MEMGVVVIVMVISDAGRVQCSWGERRVGRVKGWGANVEI